MRHLLLCLLLATGGWAEGELEAGKALLEQRRYAEALAQFQEGLKAEPDSSDLLFQAGQAAYQAGQGPTAVTLWKRLLELEPTNWRVMARLVQAYQLTGDLTARDAQRQALYALRQSGQVKALGKETDFCRDQFQTQGRTITVFEKFVLQGSKALRYVFIISRNGEKEPYSVTLGSYDSTTRIARESHEISSEQRIYHLDYHAPDRQATYVRYVDEPAYDELKKAVLGVLDGSLKPLNSSQTK